MNVALHVLHPAPLLFELPPNGEQKLGDAAAAVEIGLDALENAAVLPVRARCSGTALGPTLGNQLDHAQGAVRCFRFHADDLRSRRARGHRESCGIGLREATDRAQGRSERGVCCDPVRRVRVSRSRARDGTDGIAAAASDDEGMSYAVLWRENGDPIRAGKLVVQRDRLVLEGADGRVVVRRELAYRNIHSVRIDRGPHERLDGRPVAVLETDANTFEIASVPGRGELNEIVARVGSTLGATDTATF